MKIVFYEMPSHYQTSFHGSKREQSMQIIRRKEKIKERIQREKKRRERKVVFYEMQFHGVLT